MTRFVVPLGFLAVWVLAAFLSRKWLPRKPLTLVPRPDPHK